MYVPTFVYVGLVVVVYEPLVVPYLIVAPLGLDTDTLIPLALPL